MAAARYERDDHRGDRARAYQFRLESRSSCRMDDAVHIRAPHRWRPLHRVLPLHRAHCPQPPHSARRVEHHHPLRHRMHGSRVVVLRYLGFLFLADHRSHTRWHPITRNSVHDTRVHIRSLRCPRHRVPVEQDWASVDHALFHVHVLRRNDPHRH